MTTRSLFAAAIVAALCAAPALAQEGPPKPPAEMSQLAFFGGSWPCGGTIPATPLGPGGKSTGKVTSQTDLGGFWQSGQVKATMAGVTMEGMFHMTYEPGSKQFVSFWVDNMGAF